MNIKFKILFFYCLIFILFSNIYSLNRILQDRVGVYGGLEFNAKELVTDDYLAKALYGFFYLNDTVIVGKDNKLIEIKNAKNKLFIPKLQTDIDFLRDSSNEIPTQMEVIEYKDNQTYTILTSNFKFVMISDLSPPYKDDYKFESSKFFLTSLEYKSSSSGSNYDFSTYSDYELSQTNFYLYPGVYHTVVLSSHSFFSLKGLNNYEVEIDDKIYTKPKIYFGESDLSNVYGSSFLYYEPIDSFLNSIHIENVDFERSEISDTQTAIPPIDELSFIVTSYTYSNISIHDCSFILSKGGLISNTHSPVSTYFYTDEFGFVYNGKIENITVKNNVFKPLKEGTVGCNGICLGGGYYHNNITIDGNYFTYINETFTYSNALFFSNLVNSTISNNKFDANYFASIGLMDTFINNTISENSFENSIGIVVFSGPFSNSPTGVQAPIFNVSISGNKVSGSFPAFIQWTADKYLIETKKIENISIKGNEIEIDPLKVKKNEYFDNVEEFFPLDLFLAKTNVTNSTFDGQIEISNNNFKFKDEINKDLSEIKSAQFISVRGAAPSVVVTKNKFEGKFNEKPEGIDVAPSCLYLETDPDDYYENDDNRDLDFTNNDAETMGRAVTVVNTPGSEAGKGTPPKVNTKITYSSLSRLFDGFVKNGDEDVQIENIEDSLNVTRILKQGIIPKSLRSLMYPRNNLNNLLKDALKKIDIESFNELRSKIDKLKLEHGIETHHNLKNSGIFSLNKKNKNFKSSLPLKDQKIIINNHSSKFLKEKIDLIRKQRYIDIERKREERFNRLINDNSIKKSRSGVLKLNLQKLNLNSKSNLLKRDLLKPRGFFGDLGKDLGAIIDNNIDKAGLNPFRSKYFDTKKTISEIFEFKSEKNLKLFSNIPKSKSFFSSGNSKKVSKLKKRSLKLFNKKSSIFKDLNLDLDITNEFDIVMNKCIQDGKEFSTDFITSLSYCMSLPFYKFYSSFKDCYNPKLSDDVLTCFKYPGCPKDQIFYDLVGRPAGCKVDVEGYIKAGAFLGKFDRLRNELGDQLLFNTFLDTENTWKNIEDVLKSDPIVQSELNILEKDVRDLIINLANSNQIIDIALIGSQIYDVQAYGFLNKYFNSIYLIPSPNVPFEDLTSAEQDIISSKYDLFLSKSSDDMNNPIVYIKELDSYVLLLADSFLDIKLQDLLKLIEEGSYSKDKLNKLEIVFDSSLRSSFKTFGTFNVGFKLISDFGVKTSQNAINRLISLPFDFSEGATNIVQNLSLQSIFWEANAFYGSIENIVTPEVARFSSFLIALLISIPISIMIIAVSMLISFPDILYNFLKTFFVRFGKIGSKSL